MLGMLCVLSLKAEELSKGQTIYIPTHINAKFQVQDASFSILEGSLLDGGIPPAKAKLVEAWIEIHRESLLSDWELAVNGQTPFPIDPLR